MRKLLFVLLFAVASVPLQAQHFVDGGDGVRIWYTEVGKGSPIIVVHGGPGMDHLTLEADFAPLERHHRVIYYDQRGGGRSTLPANPALLTIDHHVADLEALRQSLGLDKVTLVAHSFGPAIAALYAIAIRNTSSEWSSSRPSPLGRGSSSRSSAPISASGSRPSNASARASCRPRSLRHQT